MDKEIIVADTITTDVEETIHVEDMIDHRIVITTIVAVS